jgi:ribosome-binding protein aMBF1 (putative translation factor)
MFSNTNQQDWEPVIFKKKIGSTVTSNNLRDGAFAARDKQNPTSQKLAKIEKETETFKIKKISSKVSKEIQKGRLAKKLNQKQLANAVHVTPKVIAEFESGKGQPNEAIKRKIANYLNISI